MGISVIGTETFWGDKAIDGAIGQLSETKGPRGEVAGVDVLEVELSLAVPGASSLESEVS